MPVVRIIFIIVGTISLILGVVGIFLPLLPTTPFLLLTSYLYFKSSPRCYNWLMRQPYLGPYIRNFKENKVIPVRAKIVSLTLMWGSITYCVVFLVPLLWVKIVLVLISVVVTVYILSFKNK